MRFKLDENIGWRGQDLLKAAGHEVRPTRDDGTADAQLFRSERGLRPRNRLWGRDRRGPQLGTMAPSE
jgi:hypothetical protein